MLLFSASPCWAQPLSTLLNPPLFHDDALVAPAAPAPVPLSTFTPLTAPMPLAGPAPRSASGKPGGPCTAAAGSLSGAGSGPGEYGHFMPSSAGPAATAPDPKPGYGTGAPGVDRPLYGGVDRPLWSEGGPPARPAAAPVTGSPATPRLPMDRPLWTSGAPVPCTPAKPTRTMQPDQLFTPQP